MPRRCQDQLGLGDTRARQGIRVEFAVPLGIPEVTHACREASGECRTQAGSTEHRTGWDLLIPLVLGPWPGSVK